MLPVVLSWLGALSVQRKGYFFSNWLKETSAGQGRPCPERALVSVLTYVGHSPAATCPLPLVSPGEHSGWPPAGMQPQPPPTPALLLTMAFVLSSHLLPLT